MFNAHTDMLITSYSNFFNHHQKPVADEIFKELGLNFTFVSTMDMPQSFKDAGYPDYSNVPYNLLSFENERNYLKAKELMMTSDVVIFGDAPYELVLPRIKQNKPILFTAERFFKQGTYQNFDIRILWELYHSYTKYRKGNNYMLCSGAFTANDLNWVFAFPNKKLKWGYFTSVDTLDVSKILKQKNNKEFKILFIARHIKWKKPFLVLETARKMHKLGMEFTLEIIGSGELNAALKQRVTEYGLEKQVQFLGNLPNGEVQQKLRESHCVLLTSDRNEGWGAVANEAMANGCTIIGSNQIGSMPYLIRPRANGLIFKSGSVKDLTKKVLLLYQNRELCKNLAVQAYRDISTTWSPENAAGELIKVCRKIEKNNFRIEQGTNPCTEALATKFSWYKKK